MNIWELCSPGITKWVEMMNKEGELKIGNDKKDKDGDVVYVWTGEDEIVSSIISYIIYNKME